MLEAKICSIWEGDFAGAGLIKLYVLGYESKGMSYFQGL